MAYGTCNFERIDSVEEGHCLLDRLENGVEEEDKNPWSKGQMIKVTLLSILSAITVYTLLLEPEIYDYPNFLVSTLNSTPIEFPINVFKQNANDNVNTFHLTIRGPFYDITNEENNYDNYEQLGINLLDKQTNLRIGGVNVSFIPHYYRLANSDLFIRSNGVKKIILDLEEANHNNTILQIKTTSELFIPLLISGYMSKDSITFLGNGILYGGLCLIGLYMLIIGDFIHRTTASMLVSILLIGIMSHFDSRPTLNQLMNWLDVETLVLLFSMMVIVSILSDTNVFAYLGFKMFKLSKGRIWILLMLLCLQSALISSFLDNVTTILLLTPIIIQICQAIKTDTKSVLVIVTIFSNIGGTATIIGDPPNVIIGSDPLFSKSISFNKFLLHMGPVAFIIGCSAFLLIRFVLCKNLKKDMKDKTNASETIKEEIDIWKRIYENLPVLTKQEQSVKKLARLKIVDLNQELIQSNENGELSDSYNEGIQESDCEIQNLHLLIKSLIVLIIMIFLFFGNSILNIKLPLSWIALSGAISLIILADERRIESLLNKVEWSTLIFFACLFVIMGTLETLGLLDLIAKLMESGIKGIESKFQLPVSILLILWVSGLLSSFVDNIPFTTMMIPLLKSIHLTLSVPLEPLIWALSLGTCLGGNGTLVGASANLVCAGIAKQHGHHISFGDFFKLGFPVVLLSLIISTLYLMICHVLFEWH